MNEKEMAARAPGKYKLNPWFDTKKCEPSGFGINVLFKGKWCHVLNEKGDGPLLITNENEARARGREIAAKLPA